MLIQIAICAVLIVATTFVHAVGMSLALRWLVRAQALRLSAAAIWVRSAVVAALVLILFAATLVEATLWAVTYRQLRALPDFGESMYFSMVTYTTLGYGDVVLDGQWRLLSALEAANGIIMFAWTTALVIVALRSVSKQLPRLREADE